MAWTALTVSDARAAIAGADEQDLLAGLTASGQPDPIEAELARVIAEVRSYIPALRVDPSLGAGLLPDTLFGVCVDILRLRLATRLAAGRQASEWLVTEPRRKAAEDARAYLRDVARGLIAVEAPPPSVPPAEDALAPGGYHGSDTPFTP